MLKRLLPQLTIVTAMCLLLIAGFSVATAVAKSRLPDVQASDNWQGDPGTGDPAPGDSGPTPITGPITGPIGPTWPTGPGWQPMPTGPVAHLAVDGRRAVPPPGAPRLVRRAIHAANKLVRKPYKWGGGHASFRARGYDCSGAVGYVLHAIGRLRFTQVSGQLEKFGRRGPGRWITVYANRIHTFMIVAGLRFDTSGVGESGPRWRIEPRWVGRFFVRHPTGL